MALPSSCASLYTGRLSAPHLMDRLTTIDAHLDFIMLHVAEDHNIEHVNQIQLLQYDESDSFTTIINRFLR